MLEHSVCKMSKHKKCLQYLTLRSIRCFFSFGLVLHLWLEFSTSNIISEKKSKMGHRYIGENK